MPEKARPLHAGKLFRGLWYNTPGPKPQGNNRMKTDYAAQCRFFTAEDACRIALQAYYAATRHLEPPPGEPWMIDGTPWSSATDFVEAFHGEVQARLGLLALDRLGEFHQVSVDWNLLTLAGCIEPEKMAPIISRYEAEKAEIETEVLGLSMNDLPPGDNPAHNHSTREFQNAG